MATASLRAFTCAPRVAPNRNTKQRPLRCRVLASTDLASQQATNETTTLGKTSRARRTNHITCCDALLSLI